MAAERISATDEFVVLVLKTSIENGDSNGGIGHLVTTRVGFETLKAQTMQEFGFVKTALEEMEARVEETVDHFYDQGEAGKLRVRQEFRDLYG